MSEDLSSIETAMWVSGAGRLRARQEIEKPFLDAFAEHAVEAGLEIPAHGPAGSVPEFASPSVSLEDRLPKLDFGLSAFAVGALIFIGSTVGQWVVGRLCDHVYDDKLKPAFRELRRRARAEQEQNGGSAVLHLDHWFDVDQVLIRIEIDLATGDDDDGDLELIREVLRRARAWIESNGITKPVMVYRISRGEISAPRLLDKVPSGD